MTVSEIINKIKNDEDNEYVGISDRMKRHWISTLDWKVRNDLYRYYVEDEAADYSGHDDGDSEVLIPEAHHDVYKAYVSAQCDLITGDTERYQIHFADFSLAWENFVSDYNRSHKHKRTSGQYFY